MPNKLEGHRAVLWLPEEDIEEGALQQIKNIADMSFVFNHVAIMPDCHAGAGATIGTCLPTKGAVIPAAVGVDLGCLLGNTMIPLLNGTQKTLKQLTDEGGEFWVYSIDQNTQRIVPGKATALKTRSNAELVRIVVSGGEEIVCTPDHEFMLSDGSWVEAKDLQFNVSLMPLYRKWQTRDGYESVSNGKGSAMLTHKVVYEHFKGAIPKDSVIHHVNHNHFDNRPENLIEMSASDHSAYHRQERPAFDNSDPEFQKARIAGIERRKNDPVARAKMAEVGTSNIIRYMTDNPEHHREAVKDNGKRGAKYLRKYSTSPKECDECGTVSKNPTAHRWHLDREHGVAFNHKVLSVESLDYREDVYCLQVEQHHNFALAAGVFVHNCGMMAVKTSLTKDDLPDDLKPLRQQIERDVPLGIGKGGVNREISPTAQERCSELEELLHPDNQERDSFTRRYGGWYKQLGSLGGGNHFIEVVLDEQDIIWAFLHSGSRGIGNKIARNHIKIAQQLMNNYHIPLVDKNLAYLAQGTVEFTNYMREMQWAQIFALKNRDEMMDRVLVAMGRHIGPFFKEQTIKCHHNFTQWEHHYGENIIVSRKGAISAKAGEYGLIPGSMGANSYVVSGLGNPASFNTAPHGAGRRMSRRKANESFTLEDLDREMVGIEYNRRSAILDEAPGAYKDINTVMERSKDLVEVVHKFHQVLNVKGD